MLIENNLLFMYLFGSDSCDCYNEEQQTHIKLFIDYQLKVANEHPMFNTTSFMYEDDIEGVSLIIVIPLLCYVGVTPKYTTKQFLLYAYDVNSKHFEHYSFANIKEFIIKP
jgi:hypothetical protein